MAKFITVEQLGEVVTAINTALNKKVKPGDDASLKTVTLDDGISLSYDIDNEALVISSQDNSFGNILIPLPYNGTDDTVVRTNDTNQEIAVKSVKADFFKVSSGGGGLLGGGQQQQQGEQGAGIVPGSGTGVETTYAMPTSSAYAQMLARRQVNGGGVILTTKHRGFQKLEYYPSGDETREELLDTGYYHIFNGDYSLNLILNKNNTNASDEYWIDMSFPDRSGAQVSVNMEFNDGTHILWQKPVVFSTLLGYRIQIHVVDNIATSTVIQLQNNVSNPESQTTDL